MSRWPYLRFLTAYGKQARISSIKATSAFRAMTAICKNAFITYLLSEEERATTVKAFTRLVNRATLLVDVDARSDWGTEPAPPAFSQDLNSFPQALRKRRNPFPWPHAWIKLSSERATTNGRNYMEYQGETQRNAPDCGHKKARLVRSGFFIWYLTFATWFRSLNQSVHPHLLTAVSLFPIHRYVKSLSQNGERHCQRFQFRK